MDFGICVCVCGGAVSWSQSPVNTEAWLWLSFGRVKNYTRIFDSKGVSDPNFHIAQGSAVYVTLIIGLIFVLSVKVSVIWIWFCRYSCEVGGRVWVWPPRTWVIACSQLCCLSFHLQEPFCNGPDVSVDILDRTKCLLIIEDVNWTHSMVKRVFLAWYVEWKNLPLDHLRVASVVMHFSHKWNRTIIEDMKWDQSHWHLCWKK